jgi:hypothetical protein
MKYRCLNPKSGDWRNYGGRGITVCQRWVESFDNFLADMGSKPSPKHSIHRVNNDGDYTPDNCRWATALEHAGNKRPGRRGPAKSEFSFWNIVRAFRAATAAGISNPVVTFNCSNGTVISVGDRGSFP